MTSHDEKTPSAPAAEQRPTPLRAGADASVRDPVAQWAVSLLAQAEPYQEVPGRRERVWLGLRSRRLRRPLRWQLGFAALALSAGAAFASALAGWPTWLARLAGRTSSAPPPTTVARPTVEPTTPPAVAPPTAEVPAPAASTPVPSAAGNPVPQSAHPRRQANANTNANANGTEDTGPLLEAMRALRIEHNPVRARQLLTDYLGQHPRGFLAEEALVMLVEAAAAHHDSDAAALVARYHRLYPDGAFRGQVERISSAYEKKP